MEGLNTAELQRSRVTLDEAAQQVWDVVVVGSGIGGGTFGWALARAGHRVLFVESGLAPWDGSPPIAGGFAEEHDAARPGALPERSVLRRAGRDSEPVIDATARRAREFVPFIGAGAGGSSALYGMAMERFFPCDFEPGARHAAASGHTLPQAWPIRYEDFAPWYALAEALYRVRGTPDPLRAGFEPAPQLLLPPPMTPQNERLFARLERSGLHPYRLPMACEFVPGCTGCQGYLCPRACKNDSTRACVVPALARHGARWLGDCAAVRLAADARRVDGVVCVAADGGERTLRGEIVALAGGALRTPALLLRSASPDWPQGLANRSGLVGRNLMRHAIELLAIELREGDFDNRQKQFALNDFYDHPQLGKLGSVQSFGRLPAVATMLAALSDDVRHAAGRTAATALQIVSPLLRPTLRRIEAQSLLLALTVEDLPHADNAVSVDAATAPLVRLRYRLRDYERERAATLVGAVRARLRGERTRLLSQARNNQRIAHACGTCRFGADPGASVLDPNNRAHGLDNLYVVDASFFPSSGGTNPSLTIAANALRVAAHL